MVVVSAPVFIAPCDLFLSQHSKQNKEKKCNSELNIKGVSEP